MKARKLVVMAAAAMACAIAWAPSFAVTPSAANAATLTVSSTGSETFQSGGFLIKYRAGSAELRDAAIFNRSIKAAATRSGLDRLVAAGVSVPARQPAIASLARRGALPRWSLIKVSRKMDAQESAAFMRELEAMPGVESVALNRLVQPFGSGQEVAFPNDPEYLKHQWNFSDPKVGVHAEQAWRYSQGAGVVIAVVDTGIAAGNPDLQENVLPGYDMITSSYVSRRNSDERVPGGWDQGDWQEEGYCDTGASEGAPLLAQSSWHGTHVAGTIAQSTHNGIGAAGLAYKAKVLPVRVLGSCGGFDEDIVAGLVWAAGGDVEGLPKNPNPADVINLSLGGSGPCPAIYQEAIDYAATQGTIVVVAAGNSDVSTKNVSPANCKNVIVVGASGETGGKAGYSNYGANVDLSAPGGSAKRSPQYEDIPRYKIWQVVNGGARGPETDNWKAVGYDGTSMAAPHVAAAVAMIQSAVATPLTIEQMRAVLRETTTPFPIPVVGGRYVGTGILNIEAALVKALNPPCYPTCGLIAKVLANKEPLTGISGGAGKEKLYRFDAAAGKVLTIMTYGGTGNVSLYVSRDAEPEPNAADARSTGPANTETVRFSAPKAGTYYIKLLGVTDFSGVSLDVRQ